MPPLQIENQCATTQLIVQPSFLRAAVSRVQILAKNVTITINIQFTEAPTNMKTVPPAAALTVLCAVMREPQIRPTDIVHQGCHFFDINGHKAHWAGDTIDLPCSEYTSTCYTKKLAVLLQRMLETNHDFFYYVESDHHICTPMATLETLAARFISERIHNEMHAYIFVGARTHDRYHDALYSGPNLHWCCSVINAGIRCVPHVV